MYSGCSEVFQRGGGEKNQDFMLIRLLNVRIWLDVVGTLNQSKSCVEVCGGAHRCTEVHYCMSLVTIGYP